MLCLLVFSGSVFASGASATGADTVGTNTHRVYRVQLLP
jgi:hypothetical protein